MGKHHEVLGHWNALIENFSTSPLDFYALVRAGIEKRAIPDLGIKKVDWKESGVGSGQRVYLRVSREQLNFDICAAPFGAGFFFSWWLAKIRRRVLDLGFILGVLLVGYLYFRIFLKGGEAGLVSGCLNLVLGSLLFPAALFGLGALVRYGDRGLEPVVLSMPMTGFLYGFVFRPETYFNEDTAIMFRESVHHAVLEAIDAVTSAQGVRGLSEEARKVVFAHWAQKA